jgi:hypothetical protein
MEKVKYYKINKILQQLLIKFSAGTIYLSSGDKYTGDWKEGRRHGNGTYFYRYVKLHI